MKNKATIKSMTMRLLLFALFPICVFAQNPILDTEAKRFEAMIHQDTVLLKKLLAGLTTTYPRRGYPLRMK
jgi:hypothetical protein